MIRFRSFGIYLLAVEVRLSVFSFPNSEEIRNLDWGFPVPVILRALGDVQENRKHVNVRDGDCTLLSLEHGSCPVRPRLRRIAFRWTDPSNVEAEGFGGKISDPIFHVRR